MKRALISVFDKTGIVEFAKSLDSMGWEIISTGGTSKKLKEEGIKVQDISDLTKFPECFDGRVKTLHPNVEGGILAIRDNEKHRKQMAELGVEPIDIVVCNLYPFKQTILKEGVSHAEIIENIDIGGPTMIRAAAKNYKFVTVITDPEDYRLVIDELKNNGDTTAETKEMLAAKVFIHTAHSDCRIFFRTSEYQIPENTDSHLREKARSSVRRKSPSKCCFLCFCTRDARHTYRSCPIAW